jgi:predicted metalloprotease with PDZ domain
MQEFYDDWTAAHEFSHLYLPYVDSRDAWLSEGVATYYQNVVRARSGRLTAQQAWSELHAGFGRGRSEARNVTLEEATQRMYRSRFFMRVYWSGTAIAMLADIRLRQISNGTQSLDTALAALNECCMDTQRKWRARELFARLDELTQTAVFGDLYEEHVGSTRFPDLSEAYGELGLVPAGRRSVSLSNDAPLAGLRDAIMSGKDAGLLQASSE